MPFLATMPTPMMAPSRETTFRDVPVIQRARIVPNMASTAPNTIAAGSANDPNSRIRTVKTRKMAMSRTIMRLRNDSRCCS